MGDIKQWWWRKQRSGAISDMHRGDRGDRSHRLYIKFIRALRSWH